jgi:hypothetical protein
MPERKATAADIDAFIEEMKRADLEGATKMAPIDYAKLRGIFPQKVYKAIRDKRLAPVQCDCGRKVVVVEEADELFKLGRHAHQPAVQATEEIPGGDVDAGDEVG